MLFTNHHTATSNCTGKWLNGMLLPHDTLFFSPEKLLDRPLMWDGQHCTALSLIQTSLLWCHQTGNVLRISVSQNRISVTYRQQSFLSLYAFFANHSTFYLKPVALSPCPQRREVLNCVWATLCVFSTISVWDVWYLLGNPVTIPAAYGFLDTRPGDWKTEESNLRDNREVEEVMRWGGKVKVLYWLIY